jgi:negative regulator of flagellin synthesis FlgM
VTKIHHGLDLNGPASLSSGSTEKAQSTQSPLAQALAQTQQGSTNPSGEVDITPTAQLLAQVEQQLAGTPDVDQNRVDAIRQAVNSGTYQVDSSRVADGLLAAQRLDNQAAAGASAGSQSNPVKAFEATAQLGGRPGPGSG